MIGLSHLSLWLIIILMCCSHVAQAIGSEPTETITNSIATQRKPLSLKLMFPGIELQQPLGMIQAPADKQNWYVLEKNGRIVRVFQSKGRWQSESMLDISTQVDSSSEGGLLGLAFHPQFALNQQLFVSYTRKGSKKGVAMQSVLSRFNLIKGKQLVDSSSEKIILLTDQPYSNHNGGQIAFSQQGYLFYGLGDGGSGGDPHSNGQNINSLLGAMLRLDVNHSLPYQIPATNPLQGDKKTAVTRMNGRAEIYAWGLRNPWRWSFDRLTGELWLADVGQDLWEEVNNVKRGGNYGWNKMEGLHCFTSSSCQKNQYLPPVLEYGHEKGRCSITGGYVYRGKNIKSLYGRYVYGDFCSGEIWSFAIDAIPVEAALILNTDMNISSFAEDLNGELYVIDITGHIHKLNDAK